MARRDRYEREAIEFARALTFFDAIYAFALTLLVTTINDFSPQAWRSLHDLLNTNGSALLSFAISFIVVVQFWRGSHRTLGSFRYLDSRLIGMHLVAMFGVILIPFTTEALGEPGLSDLPLPTALYALNVAWVSLAQFAVLYTAERRDVRDDRMSKAELRSTVATSLVIPVVFLASIPVAFLAGPTPAKFTWIAMPFLANLVEQITQPPAEAD